MNFGQKSFHQSANWLKTADWFKFGSFADYTKMISAMGLQATASKRKYELGYCKNDDTFLNCGPAKSSRWSGNLATTNGDVEQQSTPSEDSIAKLEAVAVSAEPWGVEPIVDSISKLQAVAVPGDTWGSDSKRPTLATTLLSTEELDDEEDDFEDEFEEDESIIPTYCPLRYQCLSQRNFMPHGYTKPNYYSEPFPQQNCSRTANQLPRMNNYSWPNQQNSSSNYYVATDSYPQQTIRCAENGKSYLELGSSSFNANMGARHPKRCCDGRGTWCNSKACYKEIRLKIRNLSMFKLSRFRQVTEQSLYRSVLICNTLKYIDKEMESDEKDTIGTSNIEFSAVQTQVPPRVSSQPSSEAMRTDFHHQQQNHFRNNNNDSSSRYLTQQSLSQTTSPSVRLANVYNNLNGSNDSLHPYDHYPFRDSQSGRATPFPAPNQTESDSGYGDDDCGRTINWSSVLNLSSQSALDPLNNNDLYSPLPTSSLPSQQTTTTNSVSFFTSTATVPAYSITQVAPTQPSSSWEYGFLDMDLGLGPEFTELLPSWKVSSDDLLKSVSPAINANRSVHESELESPTHIMVGS